MRYNAKDYAFQEYRSPSSGQGLHALSVLLFLVHSLYLYTTYYSMRRLYSLWLFSTLRYLHLYLKQLCRKWNKEMVWLDLTEERNGVTQKSTAEGVVWHPSNSSKTTVRRPTWKQLFIVMLMHSIWGKVDLSASHKSRCFNIKLMKYKEMC